VELLVIRHGLPLTVQSEDGPADPSLSEEGREQAAKLARWLADEPIDRIYTSPMARAAQTAAPLAELKGMTPVVEPGIVEFDSESNTYIPLEELKRTNYERWKELMDAGWYSAMDPEEFQRIVVEAMERIIADNRGGRVAVVCHGGVINIWSAHLLKLKSPLFFNPYYTSINRFMAASSGERSLVSLNETGHLR